MQQEQSGSYSILQDNLVPFYLVEDRLRDNFGTISRFIASQQAHNHRTDSALESLRLEHSASQAELT